MSKGVQEERGGAAPFATRRAVPTPAVPSKSPREETARLRDPCLRDTKQVPFRSRSRSRCSHKAAARRSTLI